MKGGKKMAKTKAKKVVKEKVVKEKKVRERKPNAKDTPQEVIDRMNETHTEWKTTKQVKYDRDGKREE